MQREDPGRPAIARNIAVADATGPDRATHTASWRAYLEALYTRTILSGSLRTHAKERSQLHQAFAGASAPRSLAADPTDEEGDDEAAVAGFLTSRCRLRSFTRHTLLAFLTDKLDLDAATLLLGVARTDDDEARTAAEAAMLEFVTEACSPLPPRVRGPTSGWPQTGSRPPSPTPKPPNNAPRPRNPPRSWTATSSGSNRPASSSSAWTDSSAPTSPWCRTWTPSPSPRTSPSWTASR